MLAAVLASGRFPLHAADTLATRTYVGLLAAQFLAAFNDQAIHAAAMFFAINTRTLSEAQAISLMPILFYSPWAIFCTLAGYLADRFSKRHTLVFWKFAEVAICALALTGFWLGTDGNQPHLGAWIVLATVFLMGMHSAFFVPAKYGVMPEILQPHLLSRGNGLLESLSFLAVILGTVCGGVLSFVFLRREANIGFVLLALAVVGALASLAIRRMPPANPHLRFPPYLYGPLLRNLRILLTTRTLSFAVIGIAFFTFIVAFMRATVYMFGESQNPRWDELKTSLVVGTVALGVGLGSPLAGWVSGRKVELGLIPIGALGMVVGCICAALMLNAMVGLVAAIILIGVSTGFYLVPLFTLLQYRAPKTAKGDMVASSNFINVMGAIVASLLFAGIVLVAKQTGFIPAVGQEDAVAQGVLEVQSFLRGRTVHVVVDGTELGQRPEADDAFDLWNHLFSSRGEAGPEIHVDRSVREGDVVVVSRFRIGAVEHLAIRPIGEPLRVFYDARRLPQFLFFGAGAMTLAVLLVLWYRVPDLHERAATLLRSLGRRRLILEGLAKVPGDGPVILCIDAPPEALPTIRASIDRHVTVFAPDRLEVSVVNAARSVLSRGDVVGVLMSAPAATALAETFQAQRVPVVVTGDRVIFADGVHSSVP